MAERKPPPDMAIDMTPMIDMTFQLIAFFMILINFSDADQDQRIQLPESVLARPPEGPAVDPITVNIDKDGKVIMAGQVYDSPKAVESILNNERALLEAKNKSAASATIIMRAHGMVKTGVVQEAIQVCQKVGFEKFTLRAMEKAE